MEKAIRLTVAMAAAVAVLALAPTAFAQSAGGGYGGQAGEVAGQVQQGGNSGNGSAVAGAETSGGNRAAASNASSGSGVLPFTGLDLALIAGGGLVLLGAGVALSRLVARNPA